MPEYIEREEALVRIRLVMMENYGFDTRDVLPGLYLAELAVEKMPAADAEPVRHGRWKEVPNFYAEQEGAHKRKCSFCNEYTSNLGSPLKYCPNCGAKMDIES